MFALLAKISRVRDLVRAGDYQAAGQLVYEIIGELTGWGGRSAAEGSVAELESCYAECEGLVADCEAQGRAAGGMIALALLQLFGPTLLELLKKVIENRKA